MPENIEQKSSTETGVTAPDGQVIFTGEESEAAKIIKTVVFVVLGLGLIFGNFFLESYFGIENFVKTDTFSAINYEEENIIPDQGIIRFDSDYSDHNFELKSSGDHVYIFKMESGHIWGNFENSNARVNILIKNTVIIPDHSTFDLEFDGERINLATYNGDTYMGFLPETIELTEYADPYSDLFMNRMLVPRDTQVIIPTKKVNEDIQQLLYSKLVKEFKYTAIPSSAKTSAWVTANFTEDKKYEEGIKQDYISQIIAKGASVRGILSDFVFWAEENLTFIPEKKETMILDHLFHYVDDAIYYANQGNEAELQQSLSSFDSYYFTIPAKITKSENYFKRLDEYLDKFVIFTPVDKEYEVKKALLARKFLERRDQLDVVGIFWLDVYKGMDVNDVAAEQALNNYYEYFDQIEGNRRYISYQNQLFDNLFLRYSIFYKDGYFAIKNALERILLDSYESGQLKEELEQAFVSNKIDFLKRLRQYFFDGEISVDDSKEIFSRLFEEINDLMAADNSEVAVIELFDSQLSDMDDFWGYLNSPEYHTKVYGRNYEERYKNYLEERDKIWNFINVHEDVLGEGTAPEIELIDVVREIEAAISSNSDVSDLEVGKIKDLDQRYVEISATIGGYPFKGQYDRDTDSLKDVYAYDELISERPVKLGSLLAVLQSRFAELVVDNDNEDEEVTLETTAQRYARIYVAEKVIEYGFIADMENVSVVDEDTAIYRVTEAGFESGEAEDEEAARIGEEVFVTFDLKMNGELATNVYLVVDGNPMVLDSEYTLEELNALVVASVMEEEEEESGNLEVKGGASEADDSLDVFAPILR